jgi:hypothetical protein
MSKTLMTSLALAASSSALAQVNGTFVVQAPTLSEVGLGLLVALLGAVGAYVVRRKK